MCCAVGGESADRNRERSDVAGQVRPGEGLSVDFQKKVPANGGLGRSEHPCHNFRQEKQS